MMLLCEEPSPFVCLSVEVKWIFILKKTTNSWSVIPFNILLVVLQICLASGPETCLRNLPLPYVLMWFSSALVNHHLIGYCSFENTFRERVLKLQDAVNVADSQRWKSTYCDECESTNVVVPENHEKYAGKPLCRTIKIYFQCSYIMLIN